MSKELIHLSDDRLSFEVTEDDGLLTARLRVLESGVEWGPTPLLRPVVHDRPCRRTMLLPVQLEVYAVREQVAGAQAYLVVGDPRTALEFGVTFEVRDGELRVRFLPLDLYERRDELFRLETLRILPDLATAGKDGHLLLPIGTGMLVSPADKPRVVDRFLIYMEQPRWELTPLLPVTAAGRPEGGLVLIAGEGASDAELTVAADGEGGGGVAMGMMLRRGFFDPVNAERREIVYSPLPAGEDLVHATARRLRRFVTEDCGKLTLESRAHESESVRYALDAVTMKLFFGIQNQGAERADHLGELPTYQNWMTFAEAEERLRRLRDLGVERIYTQSVGWNIHGHDGLYPTRFPIDERAGGEAGFRRLLQAGRKMGFRMSVHDDFMMNFRKSPDWDPDCITHDEAGRPLLHGWWGGGPEYGTWPLALPHERLRGHLERMRDLGVEGPYYCDYMMQPLELNFHPRFRGSRADFCRGMQRILREAAAVFGGSAVEIGTLPGVLACDYVATRSSAYHLTHWSEEWPIYSLRDRVVPLWQLALHGLVLCECGGGPFWERVMRCVLWGDTFRDEWQAREGRHATLTEERMHGLAAVYELAQRRFGYLKAVPLEKAVESAPGTWETLFADGTRVEADFTARTLRVDGEDIPQPDALRNV